MLNNTYNTCLKRKFQIICFRYWLTRKICRTCKQMFLCLPAFLSLRMYDLILKAVKVSFFLSKQEFNIKECRGMFFSFKIFVSFEGRILNSFWLLLKITDERKSFEDSIIWMTGDFIIGCFRVLLTQSITHDIEVLFVKSDWKNDGTILIDLMDETTEDRNLFSFPRSLWSVLQIKVILH